MIVWQVFWPWWQQIFVDDEIRTHYTKASNKNVAATHDREQGYTVDPKGIGYSFASLYRRWATLIAVFASQREDRCHFLPSGIFGGRRKEEIVPAKNVAPAKNIFSFWGAGELYHVSTISAINRTEMQWPSQEMKVLQVILSLHTLLSSRQSTELSLLYNNIMYRILKSTYEHFHLRLVSLRGCIIFSGNEA